ncbi:MAG: GNAT family N-acetyltransferase [Oscillospiraceae bacterium]|jgi:ribosomal protein S18 acetylase RimI-like enzyme|nr:GNAT family N-acetyltransferase [Oscillospiraceae bacterium]
MPYNIAPLDHEMWQGYKIMFCDYADSCYAVNTVQTGEDFTSTLTKTKLAQRREIKYTNTLLGSEADQAWGAFDGERLIGVAQAAAEGKNRLYISLMWTDEAYRRKGVAAALMDVVKQHARDEAHRAIVLQTYSCNEHAIAFYLAQGFSLVGFDTIANSNEDAENYTVPLLLGYLLQA